MTYHHKRVGNVFEIWASDPTGMILRVEYNIRTYSRLVKYIRYNTYLSDLVCSSQYIADYITNNREITNTVNLFHSGGLTNKNAKV